jgi:hypothetical protein
VRQIPDAVDAVVCAPDDGWKYHPKHVEQFPDINKLCDVSGWMYEYIGILLGAHPILHISRIKVNAILSRPFILGSIFKVLLNLILSLLQQMLLHVSVLTKPSSGNLQSVLC